MPTRLSPERAPARPAMSRRRRRRLMVTVSVTVVALLATGAGLAGVAALSSGRPILGPDEVPAEYRALVREAARRCPAVPMRVFAAQLAQESGYDAAAVSRSGAQGIAQFMPSTWEQYGVDGDGDGVADVWNPADAIPAAADLNCVNRDLVREVPGDRLANILAAYNAGFAAVREHAGVPPFPETQDYVQRILTRAEDITV